MKRPFCFIIIISFILTLIVLYSIRVEPNLLVLTNKNLYVPNWNAKLDGFKIGVISDIHIGTRAVDLDKLNHIIDIMNNQEPDLIVLLGDLDAKAIYNSKIPTKDISSSLKRLKAKYSVVSILGNHDYYPGGIVKSVLKGAGIKILENENYFIYPLGQAVKITGLKDLWYFHPDPEKIIGQYSADTPVILLEHNPDLFPEVPSFVSLTLSGHMHGGEICLPFLGSPIIPSKFGQQYIQGHIAQDNKHMYVTRGIGTLSGMRFCALPEVVLIKLYKQTPETKITNTVSKKGLSRKEISEIYNFFSKIHSF